jgi:hypothetical protein
MPSRRWCITGLQTMTSSKTRPGSIPASSASPLARSPMAARTASVISRVAAGVHHGVAHPAHQVLAEADLRVHHARGGQHATVREVAQMRRDGGGAEVDGKPVKPALMQPGPDAEDLVAVGIGRAVQRDADLPVALAQRGLQRCRTASGAVTPVIPHCSASAAFSRSRSPEGSCMSGSATSTRTSRVAGSMVMGRAEAALRTTCGAPGFRGARR